MNASCCIWRFRDGKPGHENQTRGLVQALAARYRLDLHDIHTVPAWRAALWWAGRRFPPADALPDPDLIVGAGHATHVPMLAARRARGGRAVVLMKPSLPIAWFDLCLIPEHDAPPEAPNVLATRGVLNPVRPAPVKDPAQGLILLGGPSRHHDWPLDAVLEQVRAVVEGTPGVRWEVTDSRRSPPAALARLAESGLRRVTFHPWRETPPGWLAERLAQAGRVWVSEDSVSMLYEALTAGAAVGLIEVPRRSRGRVARGVDALAAEGLVLRFGAWRAGRPLEPPAQPLDEAGRCAEAILARGWCPGRPD